MIELNKIYNENCLDTMARMDDDFVDLTVTSPPYDDLRNYNGFDFDFFKIARALYRVTKPGGVVVWIVGDQVKDGSETCTSFRQATYFKKHCGFNLHDTMIYLKNAAPFPGKNRYAQAFDYMFVFSKGAPITFNQIRDRKNSTAGEFLNTIVERQKDGSLKHRKGKNRVTPDIGPRMNYWLVKNTPRSAPGVWHPARFPESLARDHIITWSNPGDIVYDPMIGSGTTARMAAITGRNFIGSEISKEYCEKILETPFFSGHMEFQPAGVQMDFFE